MDTKVLLRQAEAALERLRVTARTDEKPDETPDLMPDEFVRRYEALRNEAIGAYGRVLASDAGYFKIKNWLIDGGVHEDYLLTLLLQPEHQTATPAHHRGNWAGMVEMAKTWAADFPDLQHTATLYEELCRCRPGLVFIGGSFTRILGNTVKRKLAQHAQSGQKWLTFLISSPGGRVSVLSDIDDAYRSYAFGGRTCWCIDFAGSCGAFCLAAGNKMHLWPGSPRSELPRQQEPAVAMFHQVRTILTEPTVLSLHDMEFMADRFRVAQTEIDDRCILPNFSDAFKKLGKGNVREGYRWWLGQLIPAMLNWPIFRERGTNPRNGTPWEEQALKDHFISLCPFTKETDHLGGIMEALYSAIPEYDNFEFTPDMLNDFFPSAKGGRKNAYKYRVRPV
jgi:ATP-dependent protease ClpP protease subunit